MRWSISKSLSCPTLLGIAYTAPLYACAVCGGQDSEEIRLAFFLTTILLSVLPVAFIGGIMLYLYRRHLKLEGESGSAAAPSEVVNHPSVGLEP